jgi:Family of unknown function (DUF5519)
MDLLDQRVQDLPGVRKGRSRFGGRWAYLIEAREIAHVHGPRELDLRLTREVIRDRRASLRADSRIGFRPGPSDWLSVRVRTSEDVEFAFELFEEAWRASQ